MSNHPTSFTVADIEGVEISHKKFLTGVLLFSKKIEAYSPEQNVGLLLPSSGGGKTDFGATKKIALVNDHKYLSAWTSWSWNNQKRIRALNS